MTTIALWYLVTIGGYNNNTLIYSPPMKDFETCQNLSKGLESVRSYKYVERTCIQIPTEVIK